MTKTNARRAVRRYIADWLRSVAATTPPLFTFERGFSDEWTAETLRIADRIERGDLVQGRRLRLE